MPFLLFFVKLGIMYHQYFHSVSLTAGLTFMSKPLTMHIFGANCTPIVPTPLAVIVLNWAVFFCKKIK